MIQFIFSIHSLGSADAVAAVGSAAALAHADPQYANAYQDARFADAQSASRYAEAIAREELELARMAQVRAAHKPAAGFVNPVLGSGRLEKKN